MIGRVSIRAASVAAAVAVFLVGAGLSTAAALRAIAEHPRRSAAASTRPMMPIVAVSAQTALASPAAGATGTTALPAVPVPASWAPGPAAAAPFLTGAAGALARGRALECLAAAVYYEAASEPDAGQQAVAQVVLNRVRHPAFPNSVCGVVYQGSERAGCQFSFACDGAMARVPSTAGWARAVRVAAMALSGRVYAPVGLATHYHTYAVTPAWNRSLVMTDAEGAHFFHRWKGYWGTAAAFRQRYAGTEPLPGPHPRPPVPGETIPLPVMALAGPVPPAPLPAVQTATAQAAYAESGAPLSAAALPESTILDRWRDSGKPLR